MILLGGFLMAIGYGFVSDCLIHYSYGPCWSVRYAFGFYAGGAIALLDAVILVGPSVAGSLGKLRGAGSDT